MLNLTYYDSPEFPCRGKDDQLHVSGYNWFDNEWSFGDC